MRWISAITLHLPDQVPKTLRGDRLPKLVILNTGADQQAPSVLEFFCEELPSPNKMQVLPERVPWPNSRDVINGIVAVLGFHVLLAMADAVARALSL